MDCLLDTNILLRLVQPGSVHHPFVLRALGQFRIRNIEAFLVPQVLVEFMSVATRPDTSENGLGLSFAEAKARLIGFENAFSLANDTTAVFREWRAILDSQEVLGKQIHDARIVAAMRVHGTKQILTMNGRHFARYPDITVLSPLTF